MSIRSCLSALFCTICLILTGCGGSGHKTAHIPPPYTSELSESREEVQLAFLTNCIQNRVDLAGSYYQRARIFADKSDYEAALSDVNQAILSKDNVGEYYLLRGRINRELNNLEAAMQDVERAEALQQKDPQLYVLMADILQENNKFNESEKYIKAIMALAPYNASIHYVQGMLLTKTGDTLAGLKAIEMALDLNPRMYRGYRPASRLYMARTDYANAKRVLLAGLANFPNNPEMLLELARFYVSRSQPDSALIYYGRAIRIEKNNTDLVVEMADAYVKDRNYHAALRIYEEIQGKRPDYPSINYLIGFCQEKLWRWNTAKSYYAKELELTPGSPEARNGLWRISQLENERLEASGNDDTPSEPVRTLDDSRLQIIPIQPRKIQD